ncbi:cobyrinate a,c-diamide synthase [Desulfofustis glycolicus]|uniref:Cobyrinate a,c-diamide synthase n=1 Tax=Desulfofustis glycolicus DSM 9705 TaxID=1121409 RepID=A0A1M5WWR4_9BACT|nr:cobyrinate a,c-diamide synthase [Desulfofustis glycolicus]MCB2214506.1 cobyrinate a,c-diamide synthase [Desulfobulbaceae bacterium]SHH92037.1 hydrogenobyrinic acid a,c-diamide synthase (glutamine-hydrolysing) [Desulfofustis glycolicus DSM 9705]
MAQACFIIGATHSGAGKTTLTLGIMAALVRRGYRVQPFKCGPDFIDPTLHETVTGRVSYTLDLHMMGADACRDLFFERAETADICVLEGVMGLFDGGSASTAALAKVLQVPVFLIVDAQSSAESNGAQLKGFEEFDAELTIGGVIFNRIGSPRHRQLIEQTVRQHCRTKIVGWVMRDHAFTIAERHLGLHMGSEHPLADDDRRRLEQTIEEHLDLPAMLELAVPPRRPERSRGRKGRPPVGARPTMRIGVAEDEAFCFYYRQNFELLIAAGFDIVRFSPLHDRHLPEGVALLYFGGGYPELHAAALSANEEMRSAVRERFAAGLPIYGECGGFMYLCRQLVDQSGQLHQMTDIFPFRTTMGTRLRRLGYRTVELQQDCLLGRSGDRLFGHEFHYSDLDAGQSVDETPPIVTCYRLDNNSSEGYSIGSALGSYVHLHFANTPKVLIHLRRQLERDQPCAVE